jgi:hypothetical protein
MAQNQISREESEELMKHEVVMLISNIGKELTISADESVKFLLHNNKSAGTRIRKAMQSIKKLAQEVRVEVQARKNKVSV